MDDCENCGENRYRNPDMTNCKKCPSGWRTQTYRAPYMHECKQCGFGHFSDTGQICQDNENYSMLHNWKVVEIKYNAYNSGQKYIHVSPKKMNYNDAVDYCHNLIRSGRQRSKIASPRNEQELRKYKAVLKEFQHRAAIPGNSGVTYVVRAWLGITLSNDWKKWVLEDTGGRVTTYTPFCYSLSTTRTRQAMFSWTIEYDERYDRYRDMDNGRFNSCFKNSYDRDVLMSVMCEYPYTD